MKSKYSPDFAKQYHSLSPTSQKAFQQVDMQLRRSGGDLSIFERQGWGFFVKIDECCSAVGSLRENGELFYWLLIGTPASMPTIL